MIIPISKKYDTEFDLYFENEENETYPLNDIKEIFSSLLELLS